MNLNYGNFIKLFSQVKPRKQVLDPALKASIRELYERRDANGNRKYSMRKLAKKFDTSTTIVHRAVHNEKQGRSGRPNALTASEELLLRDIIKIKAKYGFPVTVSEIRNMVQNYLNRKGVTVPYFQDNRPGRYWVSFFLERHESLAVRVAQHRTRQSFHLTEDDLSDFSVRWAESTENRSTSIGQIPPSHM